MSGETRLDRALRLAGGDAADGGAVDAFLGAPLRLLLEGPASKDRIRPRILELEAGPTALAFDTDERLAAFAGGADYVELPGRAAAEMLGPNDVNLAVNPGVAETEIFHSAEALRWMTLAAAAEAEVSEIRIETIGPPRAAGEALIAALDAKLAALAPLLAEAWLAGAGGGGAARLLLGLREAEAAHRTGTRALDAAAEARRRAIALAVSESARLADPEGQGLDVLFAAEGDPALAALRRFGLGFELPEAPKPEPPSPSAPGMDRDRPPILR
jgi:hypothetical protein